MQHPIGIRSSSCASDSELGWSCVFALNIHRFTLKVQILFLYNIALGQRFQHEGCGAAQTHQSCEAESLIHQSGTSTLLEFSF
jgi:hypothetical protein